MSYVRFHGDVEFYESVDLPFKVKFNFSRIIDYWKQLANNTEDTSKDIKRALTIFETCPELMETFEDVGIIDKYQEELKFLLSPLFPELLASNEIKAACMPFYPIYFNVSPRLETILDDAEQDSNIRIQYIHPDELYINACIFILNVKYGAGFSYMRTIFYDIPNVRMGFMEHYRAYFNGGFSSFTANDGFEPLSEEDIKELKDSFDNVELWKQKIPPNSFNFEGFALVHLFNVTQQQAISALKFDLLKKDALLDPETVEKIRLSLCSLLNLQELRLGFVAFDEEKQELKSIGYGLWNSILLADKSTKKTKETFCEFSQDHIINHRKIFAASDIDYGMANSNVFIKQLSTHGLKSYMAVPLVYNEKLIGILELGSTKENAINSVISAKIKDVIPLFTTALKRSIDELETTLEAIIQDKCTAIHPTVSWRFFEAAENLLKRQRFYDSNVMEEIVFNDVFPLYGQSDIKSSSTERNKSIQADLIEQLNLAKGVLDLAGTRLSLPICKTLGFRMNQAIIKTKEGLGAGDELKTLEFLKAEIYPVFDYIQTLSPDLQAAVKNYQSKLDPELGVVYKKRKDYEDSVTAINMKIADFLEKAQEEAQKNFPHYFEKYKTDGVEHNIYIGQSLVNNKVFHNMYLQNLRLWQLQTICEIERAVNVLRPQLKLPLKICSLILVHSNPMSIRFRQDEKQFDVDGAYNVRYEIVKKRIDKAYINGTEERLTQPDKIAIVYSRDEEAQEYIHYLNYLQSIGYIKEEIETLNLQNMQGVNGLRALRVELNYDLE